jgi:hypothetical protein
MVPVAEFVALVVVVAVARRSSSRSQRKAREKLAKSSRKAREKLAKSSRKARRARGGYSCHDPLLPTSRDGPA